jgi:putative transcriptional regulator
MWRALVVAAVLAAPIAARAAVEDSAKAGFASLAGRMLVATDAIRQPPFAGSVIFLLAHTPQGAVGLVVNRPLGDHPVADVLAAMGMKGDDLAGSLAIHFGGPVGTREGFVLHSTDYVTDSTQFISDGLAMTSRAVILRDILAGHGPKRSLFALGYAGWGPGQLEREMLRNAWISVPADEAIIFDRDDETKWNRAMMLRGGAP